MYKKTFFSFFFILISLLTDAQPECFSWDKVKIGLDQTRNFVPHVKQQIPQGPCLSFAFASAIETKYNIEFNKSNPNTVSLAVAYLDVYVGNYAETGDVYKQDIEGHSFNLASEKFTPISDLTRFSEFLPGVDNMNEPGYYNQFYTTGKMCATTGHHFKIANNGIDNESIWQIIPNVCDSEPITSQDYLSVGEIDKLNPEIINEIKNAIIENGPLVIQVDGSIQANGQPTTLSYFKQYSENVNYHAYSLIGWEDSDDNTTRWKVTDSWPNQIIKKFMTPPINDDDFMNFVANGDIEIHFVNDIKKNSSDPLNAPFEVDVALQNCNEIVVIEEEEEEDTPSFLTPIGFNIDQLMIAGNLYHLFFVNSISTEIDNWVWEVVDINGNYLTTNQVNEPFFSSILLSPFNSGMVTISVTAYVGATPVETTTKSVHLNIARDYRGF